jgi:hypothetical protein
MKMNKNCYVYKWTHKPTLCWYIGSRTCKNAHTNDGYLCSSKTVSKAIQADGGNWERTIIATGSKQEMYDLETEILQLFDARSDERSYNRHNNHKGIAIGGWNKGLQGVMSAWNKGITGEASHSKGNQYRLGLSPGNKGKSPTDATRKKQSESAIRRHQKAK